MHGGTALRPTLIFLKDRIAQQHRAVNS